MINVRATVIMLMLASASGGVLGTEGSLPPEPERILSAVDSLIAGAIFSDSAIEQITGIKLRIDQEHGYALTDVGDNDQDAGLFKHVEYRRPENPAPTRRGIVEIEINGKYCLAGSTIVSHYKQVYGLPSFDPPSPHGGESQASSISYLIWQKDVRLTFEFVQQGDTQCARTIIINGSLAK